jgi:zinc protease
MSFYSLLEDIESQAEAIGHNYLATGDENYVFTALNRPLEDFKNDIDTLVKTYFRPSVMHKGLVLPLPESEDGHWAQLQQESDEEDCAILTARKRKTSIEEPSYAKTVVPQKPVEFVFPKPQIYTLKNDIKLFTHKNNSTPKINIVVDFAARPCFDPEDKQGLYSFVANMMTEGTAHYTGPELAEAIESRGMSLDVYPGGVSLKMLHDDFEFGLDILKEVLVHAVFPEEEIEKIRHQMLVDIKHYWDDPRSFTGQLVRNQVYKNHPYSKQIIGTKESVAAITRDDLVDFYKNYITPLGARIAIVGDLRGYNVPALLEEKLAEWKGTKKPTMEFPPLQKLTNQEINYAINRDQVVLCLVQLSINRFDPDFDTYLLFDQIFGGGALGSMSSRLFDLREHTGLFYTISGSLIVGVDEEPGMFQIRTIVSLDRLAEAEKAIKNVIDTVVETLTEQDLEEAKRAIENVLVDNFVSNSSMAGAFLFLDRYKMPADYFDKRAAQLERITLDDMKKAVKKMLSSKDLLTVRVGRV